MNGPPHRDGVQDLVTLLIANWMLEAWQGNSVGAYLSDISAAFDKVFKDYMLAKLPSAIIGDEF